MNKREIIFKQYTTFIEKCTLSYKSLPNYTNFVRINECLQIVKQTSDDISILDITNADELSKVTGQIESLPQFQEYNRKGKKQYSNTLSMYSRFINARELFKCSMKDKEEKKYIQKPLQQIYYGAPGTGKSHEIKSLTKGKEVIRTTFHPDSDYSTFVGAYKPTTIEVPMRDVTGKVIVENGKQVTENRIIYEFVEQAFLQAYTRSWIEFANAEEGKTPVEVYLVIEEINRGNCAQIFGDLFQLLDRGEDGFSEYPIVADKDMQKQLAKAFADMPYLNAPSVCGMSAEEVAVKIRKGEILLLPNNLFIWATMNTSDQSLFPIDSAFKRRWDWQYMPIANGNRDWRISANDNEYDWWEFLEKINALIGEKTSSEDKKLGYYFCKAKDGVIDAKMFVGKVIFYLWNDVFKDYEFEGDAFNDVEGKLTFDKFYKTIDGTTTVVEEKVVRFMENLNVNPIDDQEEDEDGNMKSSVNKNYDKFSINDNGNWGKNRLAFECIKEYVSHHEEKTADEVLEIWGKMNPGVPHFIESDDVYNNRTDTSKIRSSNIKWSNGSVYVVRNGYGSNGMVEKFMKNVNDNYELLGQKIKRIVNQ
jgi:5-methylcytosine-specific restriction endonuclease McrBC GTP-binding regulatory subunit McrB